MGWRTRLGRIAGLLLMLATLAGCDELASIIAGSTPTAPPPGATPTPRPGPPPQSATPATASAPTPPSVTPGPASVLTPPPAETATATPFPAPTTLVLSDTAMEQVAQVGWTPDGQLLAAASGRLQGNGGAIHLWRPDGTLAAVLRGHTAAVLALAWTPDGQTLASGGYDGTVRLWQRDGTVLRTIAPQAGQVFRLDWTPDGRLLAVGMLHQLAPAVQVWRPDGTLAFTPPPSRFSGGKFYNLAWSPDGAWLLGGATDYTLWRADGSVVFSTPGCASCTPAWGMAWAPDSRRFAIGDESGTILIYDTTGRQVMSLQNQGNVNVLAWSPNGQVLAGGDGTNFWRADGTRLTSHYGGVRGLRTNSIAWRPDGAILASGADDGRVRLWNAAGGMLAVLPSPTDQAQSLAWSPDSTILAAGSTDQTVHLWRWPTPPEP